MKKGDTVYAINDGLTEIIPLIIYRVTGDGGIIEDSNKLWYGKDEIFLTRKEAIKIIIPKIKRTLDNRIEDLEEMLDLAIFEKQKFERSPDYKMFLCKRRLNKIER